jgi:hypothetical protein
MKASRAAAATAQAAQQQAETVAALNTKIDALTELVRELYRLATEPPAAPQPKGMK